jgi:hypothetical protein
MIDALGWEILKGQRFGEHFAPTRRKLESVFGYSSTCVPSILSGRWPDQHRNWCYFVYDPKHSPFHSLRWLRWLPAAVTGRRIFRRWLTKFVKVRLNFRGYFDLYNIPFRFIHLFDFTEKKSPLQPGGMNRGPNIFDFLVDHHIPYFVTDPSRPETADRDALIERLKAQDIDFAFVYWAGLDGLLHRVGNDAPDIAGKLKEYESMIDEVLVAAKRNYADVRLYVFSDHGMANCDEHLDLKSRIDALPLKMGKDYAVVYDSTMARYWFFNDDARKQIVASLAGVPQGRIVGNDELKSLHAYFDDGYFGQLLWLAKEGVLIVPSHMGERPIRAMHGYHPTDPQSYASLMTNQPSLPAEVTHIPNIHGLMVEHALAAQTALQTASAAKSA